MRMHYRFKIALTALCIQILLAGCAKMLDVDQPVNKIDESTVYKTDATAIAVLTDLYANMSTSPFEGGEYAGLPVFTGLSADELLMYSTAGHLSGIRTHYMNNLSANIFANRGNTPAFWGASYNAIYVANAAIEGLNASSSLTPAVKQQLLGEALFIRAFRHFLLVNVFGDIPVVVTTNYKVNSTLSRTPKELVYRQIIADLKEAQSLLSDRYLGSNLQSSSQERVRPNRWAATALLAKAYLYAGDNPNAETEASKVIAHSTLFNVEGIPLSDLFLKNSQETIWALQPVFGGYSSNTTEGRYFKLTEFPESEWMVTLSPHIAEEFESGDERRTEWVGSLVLGGKTYYYPRKYKVGLENVENREYSVQLRIGEQYLIRAEARARQNKISGANSAASDLDFIRSRAGLPSTTASNEPQMLDAILAERRSELFTEGGNRWFDLQRFGKIDEVMEDVAPEKGGVWAPYKALAPIPQEEMDRNPSMRGHQNTGY